MLVTDALCTFHLQKRKELLVDMSLCLGLPFLVMALCTPLTTDYRIKDLTDVPVLQTPSYKQGATAY